MCPDAATRAAYPPSKWTWMNFFVGCTRSLPSRLIRIFVSALGPTAAATLRLWYAAVSDLLFFIFVFLSFSHPISFFRSLLLLGLWKMDSPDHSTTPTVLNGMT